MVISASKWGNKQILLRPKEFLIMPSVTAWMMYLSDYIVNHGWNYARWYSTTPEGQEIYKKQLQRIIPRITNYIQEVNPTISTSTDY